jgi:hypothetical protein
MNRTTLILLASALVVGCSDGKSPTAPYREQDPWHPIAPSIVELTGTVVVEHMDGRRSIQLQTDDGSLYPLLGGEAALIASVAGGQVLVRGTLDASPGVVVERFQVLAMNGRDAIDGVLEETDTGLALRLAEGELRYVMDDQGSLAAHIGERLWVTGLEEPPMEFGVIEAR